MSKHIIIDWQRDGLFVAMGSRRGNNVAIETFVNTGSEGGASGSSTAISTQLFALAKQLDLHKSEATLIAPREVLEFRTLTVPRGDADEVPDMVRFQAQRQMANIGDTWPLDYILLPDQAGQDGISALAATISPAHMAEIEGTCSDLGIHLTRVLARPLEIARWGVTAGGLASAEAALIIAVSQTHADLLLASYGSLVQVRGTRLPEDPSVMAATLVAEIRRSVMAASTFLNNHPVSKILLIAAPELAERLESSISQATNASVGIIDPASILPASLPERHELALRAASRLAAIAGVLSNVSPDRREVIDLKNCKRREPKKARVREYSLIGGIAALVLLSGIYWWWSSHAELDLQIAIAKSEEKDKKQRVEATMKTIKNRQDVDKFLAGSINWLDEMVHVSSKIPPSEEVMLSNPAFILVSDKNGSSGQITVDVNAKDAATIDQLKQLVSDKEHAVTGAGPKQLENLQGTYGWTEREIIRVFSKGWDPVATKSKSIASVTPATPRKEPEGPAKDSNKLTKPAAAPAGSPQAGSTPANAAVENPAQASPLPASGVPAGTPAKPGEPAAGQNGSAAPISPAALPTEGKASPEPTPTPPAQTTTSTPAPATESATPSVLPASGSPSSTAPASAPSPAP